MFCASKRIQVVLELEEPPYPEDVDKFEEIPSSEKKSWLEKQITCAETLKEPIFCSQLHQCGPVKFSGNVSTEPGEKLDWNIWYKGFEGNAQRKNSL